MDAPLRTSNTIDVGVQLEGSGKAFLPPNRDFFPFKDVVRPCSPASAPPGTDVPAKDPLRDENDPPAVTMTPLSKKIGITHNNQALFKATASLTAPLGTPRPASNVSMTELNHRLSLNYQRLKAQSQVLFRENSELKEMAERAEARATNISVALNADKNSLLESLAQSRAEVGSLKQAKTELECSVASKVAAARTDADRRVSEVQAVAQTSIKAARAVANNDLVTRLIDLVVQTCGVEPTWGVENNGGATVECCAGNGASNGNSPHERVAQVTKETLDSCRDRKADLAKFLSGFAEIFSDVTGHSLGLDLRAIFQSPNIDPPTMTDADLTGYTFDDEVEQLQPDHQPVLTQARSLERVVAAHPTKNRAAETYPKGERGRGRTCDGGAKRRVRSSKLVNFFPSRTAEEAKTPMPSKIVQSAKVTPEVPDQVSEPNPTRELCSIGNESTYQDSTTGSNAMNAAEEEAMAVSAAKTQLSVPRGRVAPGTHEGSSRQAPFLPLSADCIDGFCGSLIGVKTPVTGTVHVMGAPSGVRRSRRRRSVVYGDAASDLALAEVAKVTSEQCAQSGLGVGKTDGKRGDVCINAEPLLPPGAESDVLCKERKEVLVTRVPRTPKAQGHLASGVRRSGRTRAGLHCLTNDVDTAVEEGEDKGGIVTAHKACSIAGMTAGSGDGEDVSFVAEVAMPPATVDCAFNPCGIESLPLATDVVAQVTSAPDSVMNVGHHRRSGRRKSVGRQTSRVLALKVAQEVEASVEAVHTEEVGAALSGEGVDPSKDGDIVKEVPMPSPFLTEELGLCNWAGDGLLSNEGTHGAVEGSGHVVNIRRSSRRRRSTLKAMLHNSSSVPEKAEESKANETDHTEGAPLFLVARTTDSADLDKGTEQLSIDKAITCSCVGASGVLALEKKVGNITLPSQGGTEEMLEVGQNECSGGGGGDGIVGEVFVPPGQFTDGFGCCLGGSVDELPRDRASYFSNSHILDAGVSVRRSGRKRKSLFSINGVTEVVKERKLEEPVGKWGTGSAPIPSNSMNDEAKGTCVEVPMPPSTEEYGGGGEEGLLVMGAHPEDDSAGVGETLWHLPTIKSTLNSICVGKGGGLSTGSINLESKDWSGGDEVARSPIPTLSSGTRSSPGLDEDDLDECGFNKERQSCAGKPGVVDSFDGRGGNWQGRSRAQKGLFTREEASRKTSPKARVDHASVCKGSVGKDDDALTQELARSSMPKKRARTATPNTRRKSKGCDGVDKNLDGARESENPGESPPVDPMSSVQTCDKDAGAGGLFGAKLRGVEVRSSSGRMEMVQEYYGVTPLSSNIISSVCSSDVETLARTWFSQVHVPGGVSAGVLAAALMLAEKESEGRLAFGTPLGGAGELFRPLLQAVVSAEASAVESGRVGTDDDQPKSWGGKGRGGDDIGGGSGGGVKAVRRVRFRHFDLSSVDMPFNGDSSSCEPVKTVIGHLEKLIQEEDSLRSSLLCDSGGNHAASSWILFLQGLHTIASFDSLGSMGDSNEDLGGGLVPRPTSCLTEEVRAACCAIGSPEATKGLVCAAAAFLLKELRPLGDDVRVGSLGSVNEGKVQESEEGVAIIQSPLRQRLAGFISALIRFHLRRLLNPPPPSSSSRSDFDAIHSQQCEMTEGVPCGRKVHEIIQLVPNPECGANGNGAVMDGAVSSVLTHAMHVLYCYTTLDSEQVMAEAETFVKANIRTYKRVDWDNAATKNLMQVSQVLAAVRARTFVLSLLNWEGLEEAVGRGGGWA
ncbi:unnamed protein product, partial [Choristocarpus tenellus]